MNFAMYWVLLGYWVVACLAEGETQYGPVLTTTSGQVRGHYQFPPNGKKSLAYLGIPYAQPPIKERRFLPPLPVLPRQGILNATILPKACHQQPYPTFVPALSKWGLLSKMDEDCLYLNIWTPAHMNSSVKSSVLVWIHGGSYTKGSASLQLYQSGIISSEEDMVVVTINYRLSVFGYLYLGHDKIPGNAGLHDQMTALKWIKSNIHVFGGDPDKITVFGESSGAASTGLLLVSPKNDVFKRAILQSGSATTPWATMHHEMAISRTLEVAKGANCSIDLDDKDAIVNCLLSKDAEILIEQEPYVPDGVSLAPVVDLDILPEEPSKLLKKMEKGSYDVLLGTNKNEGTLFFIFLEPEIFSIFSQTAHMKRNEYHNTLVQWSPIKNREAIEAYEFFYGDWLHGDRLDESFQDSLDDLVGDYFFTCRGLDTATAVSKGEGNAYVYRYEHRSPASLFPAWMGVFHSHELEFVFGEPLDPKYTYNDEERYFSRQIIRLWANFARSGNPNTSPENWSDVLSNITHWPKWSQDAQEVMHLSPKTLKAEKNERRRFCLFLDSYLPSVLERTEALNRTIEFYKAYLYALEPSANLENMVVIKESELTKQNKTKPIAFAISDASNFQALPGLVPHLVTVVFALRTLL